MVKEQRCGSARKVTPQENLINDHLKALKERAEEFFMKYHKENISLYCSCAQFKKALMRLK